MSSPHQNDPSARLLIERGLHAATADETVHERTAAMMQGLRACGATHLADRMRRAEQEAGDARRRALAFSSMCEITLDESRLSERPQITDRAADAWVDRALAERRLAAVALEATTTLEKAAAVSDPAGSTRTQPVGPPHRVWRMSDGRTYASTHPSGSTATTRWIERAENGASPGVP